MSAMRAPKSSWLVQNYEKIALIAVLVALLASALILVLRIGFGRMALTEARWERPREQKDAVPLNVGALEEKVAPLTQPYQSAEQTHALLVSELRVWCIKEDCGRPIPYNAAQCPFCGTTQPPILTEDVRDDDQDGLPNEWERLHGLNPLDPTDAHLDKDGDGFTNLEEYQFGTDPNDPASFPELPGKLRLVRAIVQPFQLLFQGVSELPDGRRFLLNLRGGGRSYFARMGETVEGFKVEAYDESVPERPMLVLLKDGETIRLEKGVERSRSEVSARMVFLLDRTTYTVKGGDSFKLKDRGYKVVDIKPNTVSIRALDTGKNYSIPLLSDSERRMLTGEAEPVGAAGPVPMPGAGSVKPAAPVAAPAGGAEF
jgi:hypothetical protein